MRLKRKVSNKPKLMVGITGNRYVVCSLSEPLHDVCNYINKSVNSIYYSERFQCYAIRIKSVKHKTLIHDCPLV